MGWLQGASQIFGGGGGGGGGSQYRSVTTSDAASQANVSAYLDGSNWTVATSGARATADNRAGAPSDNTTLLIVGGIAFAAVLAVAIAARRR